MTKSNLINLFLMAYITVLIFSFNILNFTDYNLLKGNILMKYAIVCFSGNIF